MEFIKGMPCLRCGRPLDDNKDCPCTPPSEKPHLEQPELELEEMLEIQERFASDLEDVFEGKHLEFSDHLRGMLLELWTRAREMPSSTVKELEELRQLKQERLELKQTVADLLREELPAVSDQFKSTFESVLETQLKPHLIHQLEQFDSGFDEAFVTCLERVISTSGGLEHTNHGIQLEFSPRGGELVSGLPEFKEPDDGMTVDKTQENLRTRLQWEGVLPKPTFHDSWNWRPMQFNGQTGEVAAFWPGAHEQRTVVGEEIRVHLAWDGVQWLFPNPKPVGSSTDRNELVIYINGTRQDPLQYFNWNWSDEYQGGYYVITAVTITEASTGSEVVEAEYRVRRDAF